MCGLGRYYQGIGISLFDYEGVVVVKSLQIERSKQVSRIEFSDDPCEQFLKTQKEVRFDIILEDGNETVQRFRVKLKYDDELGLPILELKDYMDNHRYKKIIKPTTNMSEVTVIALTYAWNVTASQGSVS